MLKALKALKADSLSTTTDVFLLYCGCCLIAMTIKT